jgi:hypothetical protein
LAVDRFFDLDLDFDFGLRFLFGDGCTVAAVIGIFLLF